MAPRQNGKSQQRRQVCASGPPKPKDLHLSPKNYAKLKTGRIDGLGAGDTSLILDFLPPDVAAAIFAQMLPGQDRTEVSEANATLHDHGVQWQGMEYYGQPVPRLVCVQAERQRGDEAVPMYRHPVDQHPPTHEISAPVRQVLDAARVAFGHPFNHALIQLYRSGDDSISVHADKTLDIAHGTPIVNVSFGASRLFLIRSKTKLSCGTGADVRQFVTLPHNSALAFGLESNRLFTHQIQSDKRPEGQRRADESSFGGARISLTLRVVATYQRPDGRLYGQGATHKTAQALDEAVGRGHSHAGLAPLEGQDLDSEGGRLAEAFKRENVEPDFDWETNYGGGFDVLTPGVYLPQHTPAKPVEEAEPPSQDP